MFTCLQYADCCDGSDEYDGKVNCPNTCWKAGKVARDKLKKKIATYQEGVAIRKQEVEQAKVAMAKDEAELSKLQSDQKTLKRLVEQLRGIFLVALIYDIIFHHLHPHISRIVADVFG